MKEDGSAQSLDGIDLIKSLPLVQRAEVARLCRWRRYQAGEQIIDRQSESRDIFLVVQGSVRIVIYSLLGRELTLDDVKAGAFFGELAAIDGNPRSASVMALSETVIASLSAEHFLRLVSTYPEMALLVMKRLAFIVRTATDRIIDLSTLGANNRVHAELLRLAYEQGVGEDGSVSLSPIPVHSDIASRVSTTRETVARVLSELAKKNIVVRERDALLIRDVSVLEEIVEDVRGDGPVV